MKAFIVALAVLILTAGLCTVNDIYCNAVCADVMHKANTHECAEVKEALDIFKKNEALLRASCDAEYVTEAHISLENLVLACEGGDEYEASTCKKEVAEYMKRIKNALFI